MGSQPHLSKPSLLLHGRGLLPTGFASRRGPQTNALLGRLHLGQGGPIEMPRSRADTWSHGCAPLGYRKPLDTSISGTTPFVPANTLGMAEAAREAAFRRLRRNRNRTFSDVSEGS